MWALRVDVHVLDHDGNLVDACCLAALAALMALRLPQVSVGGEGGSDIIVHSPDVKEPLPLSIHHLPVAISFGLFEVSCCSRCAPIAQSGCLQGAAAHAVWSLYQKVSVRSHHLGCMNVHLGHCASLPALPGPLSAYTMHPASSAQPCQPWTSCCHAAGWQHRGSGPVPG